VTAGLAPPGLRVDLAPWGETLVELVAAARAAEDAGAGTLWVPELHRSAFVPAAALAGATSTARIGTAVAWAFTRSPLTTALEAMDLDELADGRFVLGLGTGVRRLVEGWHGASFGSPAAHLREVVALVRRIVATAHTGDPIDADGPWVQASIRGYRRPVPPRRPDLPIHLAAVGPVLARTAGEVGDGWLGHELSSAAHVRARVLPQLDEGLRRAGREPGELERVASVVCVPHHDLAQARRWAAGTVAFYASVRTYRDVFAFHGHERVAEVVQDRFRAGDTEGMLDAVPDDLVDAVALCGPPDRIRAGLAAYDGLVDAVKLAPPSQLVDTEVTRTTQTALLDLLADRPGG
jgi:probable F420-dependent oxidoreductase